jgi:hypothetical protein
VRTLDRSRDTVCSTPCGTRISERMLRRSLSWLEESWLLSVPCDPSSLCCSPVSDRPDPRRLDGAEVITFWLGGPSPPIGELLGIVPLSRRKYVYKKPTSHAV